METNTLPQHNTHPSFPRGNKPSSHPEPDTHKQKPYPPRTSTTQCQTNSPHPNSHTTSQFPGRRADNMHTARPHYHHTKHKKARIHSPSNTDIIALVSTHGLDILFLTETPVAKDCSALCDILSNRGYNSHYHPANSPIKNRDTIPEARLPSFITQTGRGCMIAYKKIKPWSSSLRPFTLPQNISR